MPGLDDFPTSPSFHSVMCLGLLFFGGEGVEEAFVIRPEEMWKITLSLNNRNAFVSKNITSLTNFHCFMVLIPISHPVKFPMGFIKGVWFFVNSNDIYLRQSAPPLQAPNLLGNGVQ